MAYKKNDIIRFMTNQPGVHALEMFGHCEFNPDEIEKEEYIGRIKSVVADGASYVVGCISPSKSAICIADAEEVLGQLQESDLTAEQLKAYHERFESHEAPNVYDNAPSGLDESLSIEQKCEAVAAKAMKALFPDAVTTGYESLFQWLFREILPREDKFKTADILCISDFGWVMIEEYVKKLIDAQKASGMKFYGLNIGGVFGGWADLDVNLWDDGSSPMSVCDSVWEYHDGQCKEVKKP